MSQMEPKKESERAKMGAVGQYWAHLVISEAQKQLILVPRGNLGNPVSYYEAETLIAPTLGSK